jgi:hypothetical protein
MIDVHRKTLSRDFTGSSWQPLGLMVKPTYTNVLAAKPIIVQDLLRHTASYRVADSRFEPPPEKGSSRAIAPNIDCGPRAG